MVTRTSVLCLIAGVLAFSLIACATPSVPTPAATTAGPTSGPKEETKATAQPAASPKAPVASPSAAAQPKAEAPKATQLEKVVVGYASTGPAMLPLFIAKEQGLLAKRGLDVSFTMLAAGTQPMAALLSGDVHIMNISGETVSARLGGADVVYIAAMLQSPLFYLYAPADIKSVEELKGKRIGVSGISTANDSAATFILKNHGLTAGTDVTLFATGSVPNNLAALQSKGVEGAILSSPTTFQADKLGLRPIAEAAKEGWRYPSSWPSVSGPYLRTHGDLLQRYVEAQVEGTALIGKDKALAKKVLGQYMKLEDDTILEATYNEYVDKFLKVPYPPEAAIQATLDQLAPQIPAAKTAKPADFIEKRFVQQLESNGFIDNAFK